MFKKTVAVLLLLTTPFAQARAVLICSMMNDRVVEKCCCPGHTEHHMPAQPAAPDAPEASCCNVVVAISDKAFASVTSEQATLKRIAHDVPDVAMVAAPVPLLTAFVVPLRPPSSAFDAPIAGPNRLYLRTARLRL
jgi:hypothetical protein